uniref:Uncharacterized protein n=1 Tax=Oryza nivara TaxID=4536 RepID=A0A0E0IUN9_ORYNI
MSQAADFRVAHAEEPKMATGYPVPTDVRLYLTRTSYECAAYGGPGGWNELTQFLSIVQHSSFAAQGQHWWCLMTASVLTPN